ncbi:cell wall protein DAN4-like [Alosa sapidissima]|uniref:cell wall protein DAN4-like n=1 Tax=Alosa sapidissima TaxID=34773 RepID=UPI001C08A078|nr:cell wall protein DAN4-like [Alosa sapidissima]
MSYNNPYSSKTSSPSQVSAAKRSFLKDSSWIKKDGDDDDDSVFQDKLAHKTGSVSNLTKRFGGSQDLDQSRNQTSSKTVVTSSGSGVKTTTSTIETKTVTPTKPALQTKPPSSPGGKSSFTDRVFSANKPSDQTSPQSTTTTTTTVSRKTTYTETTNGVNTKILSPTSTVNTKILSPTSPVNIKSSVESTPKSPAPVPITRSSSKTISSVTESPSPTLSGSKSPSYKSSTLDNLADTLIDIPTKPADTTTVKTRTSITRKGSEVDSIPARHLDSLADTLDPFSSTTTPQEKTRGSSYDSLSDSLLSSPTKSTKTETSYTKSTKHSSGDTLISSKTSPSVQSMSKRTVSDRNVCSFCHQPITESIRMVLDELKIFSHADCFKCVGCHCKLSKLEAGDSLWVYRDAVNCDNCYMKIKDRWYH